MKALQNYYYKSRLGIKPDFVNTKIGKFYTENENPFP